MRIASIIPFKSGGGAQTVSWQLVRGLAVEHKAMEYNVFHSSDFEYGFLLKWTRVLIRCYLFLRESRPNIVITHLDSSVFTLTLAKFFFRFKLVHVFHGPPTNLHKKRPIYEFYKSTVLNFVDGFVFVSREQYKQHIACYTACTKKESRIIFNPYFRNDSQLTPDTEQKLAQIRHRSRMLWLVPGRLSHQKNQIFALKLLKFLKFKGMGAVILLAGDGEDEDQLKSACSDLDLNFCDIITYSDTHPTDVVFLGYRQDVQALMEAVDLVLLPSLYEGYPLALVEAVCLGARVVSSDCPTGPREIIESSSIELRKKKRRLLAVRLVQASFQDKDLPLWESAISAVLMKNRLDTDSKKIIQDLFSVSRFINDYSDYLKKML